MRVYLLKTDRGYNVYDSVAAAMPFLRNNGGSYWADGDWEIIPPDPPIIESDVKLAMELNGVYVTPQGWLREMKVNE